MGVTLFVTSLYPHLIKRELKNEISRKICFLLEKRIKSSMRRKSSEDKYLYSASACAYGGARFNRALI